MGKCQQASCWCPMFCLSWQNYQKKLKFHQLASLCFLPPQVSGLWLFCNLSVGLGMYKIFKERRKTKAMCILHSETRSVESLHWDVHCPAAMMWAQVLMRPTLTTIRALFAPIWHLVRNSSTFYLRKSHNSYFQKYMISSTFEI